MGAPISSLGMARSDRCCNVMSVGESRTGLDPGPPAVNPLGSEVASEERRRLGQALLRRADWIVQETVAQTKDSGEKVDESVQARFERVCQHSTPAVSRWIAGEGIDVTIDSARESSAVFGEIAAQRWASLQEVMRRSFAWRNVMAAALRECAAELDTPIETLREALSILQVTTEASMLRTGESFEKERKRTDEALAKREEELAFLATHDPLTGLPNRTLILDRGEQALVRARRHQTPVAALFVDVDNFKSINDTLGHDCGDELLRTLAARLDGVIRATDAFGRLGGDEFVVIAEELSLEAGPELIAERLLEALKEPVVLSSGEQENHVTVNASIGIAMGVRSSAEELLRDADIAMYRAKWEGKNRYVVFESGMQDALQSRMTLEMDLRDALQKDEFFLMYQPTFDLRDMRPTAFEALVRWKHPTRGIVQPNDFIPLLEETDLIVDVGRWVLHEACRQGAEWRRNGRELGVAVNVSGRQLDSDGFVGDVRDALAASELPADSLTLEITETAIMRNVEATAKRLLAIKALGVRIAIDDFGTGYSSLAHLQRFPVDAIKIDRSFTSRLTQNPEGETLIHTLVQLGKALALETLAEGIEQQQELSLLREEHCDSGQGFLFAHPLDAAAAELFVESWYAQAVPAAAGDP
jgi:diguanylate cyclase (GGDEF)-like protein